MNRTLFSRTSRSSSQSGCPDAVKPKAALNEILMYLSQRKPEPSNLPLSRPIRVLFVEDHAETREAISLLLEQAGYLVGTAGSFAEAVGEAEREEYDVYLLDIRLPDGSGIELSRTLQWLTPTVPTVYYTAYENLTEEIRRDPSQRVLIKPVHIHEIERALIEATGG
jgi:CheY-like chemotaxis protein